eukprot:scaffold5884_cov110-Isochrysis_galbana.AAC.7
MPSPSSHRHPDVHLVSGGVAAASTRRHPRGQPLTAPRYALPRLQQRSRVHRSATVATRQPE